MKIATPVATMGIRGTTGIVEEQLNLPERSFMNAADHTCHTFSQLVPDFGTGISGMWDCYLVDERLSNAMPTVIHPFS